MAVREWDGNVVFLHEVVEGAADRSYGIAVGRLAGLPKPVIARAEDILAALEKSRTREAGMNDLPLFAQLDEASPAAPMPMVSPVEEALGGIDPDRLTPREALDAIYRLKSLAEQGS
jgi:DNA mismatch repair protein MutS